MITPRDLALDPSTYDLSVVGQDLAPLVGDTDAIISDVEAAIKEQLGEWFLDTTRGVDWLGNFQQKGKPLSVLRAVLFKTIGARLGITQVLSVTTSGNNAARTGLITWLAQSDAGQLGSTVPVSP